MFYREKETNLRSQQAVIDTFTFKEFEPKNEKQKLLLNKIKSNEIIFVSGPAGTGKTMVAIKAALELLKSKNCPIDKILISKPIVEAAEEIGFLPGNIEMKIDPYMNSYHQNFNKLIGEGSTKKLMDSGVIKSVPLAYMRGETFTDTIAILDEAQNTTFLGLKLFLTRKDENSKLIIIGDMDQVDLKLKYGEINALEDAFKRFKGISNISFIEFTEEDIVRSTILIEILKRYKTK